MQSRRRKSRSVYTRKQRGGFYSEADKARLRAKFPALDPAQQAQIVHCLSQLKRFAPCLQTHPLRSHQFFYNLGRLQELLGETTQPKIWWSPIEALVTAGAYVDLPGHVDRLQDLVGVAYDAPLLAKGC